MARDPERLRPPNGGEPIRSAYLKQQHRSVRRNRVVAAPPLFAQQTAAGLLIGVKLGDSTTGTRLKRFFAPGAGIGPPTVSGQEITPASAECTPAFWDGSKWAPDPDQPQALVFNSWPGETIPGDALILADWDAGHWEAGPFSCPT